MFPVFQDSPLSLGVAVEPSFIALGPFHFAVGMNDRAWIHEIGELGEYGGGGGGGDSTISLSRGGHAHRLQSQL